MARVPGGHCQLRLGKFETGNTFPIMWRTPLPNSDYYGLVTPIASAADYVDVK
ncbi:hypothetical protein OG746_37925 [Streptomyces sp. NBC_01016]|uniref:hypothetical protein n=1 Tax=Streptomyces sp. NBC_01016 TaxID=2903720 RepID=UPI0022521AD3|nr:hypothetical protein [Streptomyces sp. NBC_01016]MCX4834493.1 hypothetical protein [Streptomyces sp. NBC_01016]